MGPTASTVVLPAAAPMLLIQLSGNPAPGSSASSRSSRRSQRRSLDRGSLLLGSAAVVCFRRLSVAAHAKAQGKGGLAEIEARLREKKSKKEAAKASSSSRKLQELEFRAEVLGRVVGGADRHGEVLVELLSEQEAAEAERFASLSSGEAEEGAAPKPRGDVEIGVQLLRGSGTAEEDSKADESIAGNEASSSSSSASTSEPIICAVSKGKLGPRFTPIVGDLVRAWVVPGAGAAEATVSEVLPRRTALLRRNPNFQMKPQTLCANLDLIVLVLSVEPNFSEGMVDRVLVSAHAQGLQVALVLNKVDLVPSGSMEREEVDARLAIYERIGYTVLRTSTMTGEGVLELRALLAGRTSILIGNSGVGKSQLLNELGRGEIAARVGEISQRLKLGCHTTTTSTLHALPGTGPRALLIDSPGARRFCIWDVEGEELKDHFVDFLPHARNCRFTNCSHLQELGCAVLDAVEAGEIQRQRYLSYQRIREDLLAGREGKKMFAGHLTAGGSSESIIL